jgi:hypothetical protein
MLQVPLERFNMAILGCKQLFKHEGLKIIVASTHVKNLINISQPHLRMWMVLLGGGEYVICVTF